jgi:hypothetical protein
MMTAYIMQMFLSNHKSKLCGGENIKTVAARNPPLPFYNHKSKLCGGENIKTVAARNHPLPFYNKIPRQIWDMSSCV